jgi:hypothetical protein
MHENFLHQLIPPLDPLVKLEVIGMTMRDRLRSKHKEGRRKGLISNEINLMATFIKVFIDIPPL